MSAISGLNSLVLTFCFSCSLLVEISALLNWSRKTPVSPGSCLTSLTFAPFAEDDRNQSQKLVNELRGSTVVVFVKDASSETIRKITLILCFVLFFYINLNKRKMPVCAFGRNYLNQFNFCKDGSSITPHPTHPTPSPSRPSSTSLMQLPLRTVGHWCASRAGLEEDWRGTGGGPRVRRRERASEKRERELGPSWRVGERKKARRRWRTCSSGTGAKAARIRKVRLIENVPRL